MHENRSFDRPRDHSAVDLLEKADASQVLHVWATHHAEKAELAGAAAEAADRRAKADEMARKVLLIHSGGYSKRMPSHSCTSKIFRDPKVMKLTSFCKNTTSVIFF